MTEETAFQNDQQEVRQATRSFWKKMLVGIGLCLVMLAFMAWVCLFHEVPLEISKETTYITEPLTADGKQVDYFRVIELECYPANMKTDENGYRMIVRAMGVPDELTEEKKFQVYEKLGLDPSVPPTMKFQDPDDFISEYVENQPNNISLEKDTLMPMSDPKGPGSDEEERLAVDNDDMADKLKDQLKRPWTLNEMPMMDKWLETNSPTLDLIAKAVRQPGFCVPKIKGTEDEKFFLKSHLELAHLYLFCLGFQTRANYRIGTVDLDGAIDDILTCKILGRRIGQGEFKEVIRIGIQAETIAGQIGIANLLVHQPTEIQLRRLLDTLIDTSSPKIPTRNTGEKARLLKFYEMLEIIQNVSHNQAMRKNVAEDVFRDILPEWLSPTIGFDWNVVAERINEAYDHPEAIPKFEREQYCSMAMFFPASRSQIVGNDAASALCYIKENLAADFVQIKCVEQLQAITLAMLIYEKQHGTLPPAWTVDEQGKPLHSWRVLLLPYLGDDAKKLYEKIRLEEPWDSEHNRQFHEAEIPFYQNSATLLSGETAYTVILGKKAAFRGSEKVKLDQFGPNSANLLLVAERNTAICWMNPMLEVTEKEVRPKIDKASNYNLPNFGFRSGAVVSFSKEFLPEDATRVLPANSMGSMSNIFLQLLEGTAEKIPSQN